MKEEFKYVVDNSKYVSINYEKVNDFTNYLGKPKYTHWAKELNLKLTEEELITLAFVIESMNFCFWQKPKWKIEYKNELLTGSNALFFSIIKEVETNPNFLKIDYLYNLTKQDLQNIFKSKERKNIFT